MLDYLKSLLSDFFTLSKSEQRGIVVFTFLTLIFLAFTLVLPHLSQNKPADHAAFKAEMEKFYSTQQHLSDSIQIERLQNKGELDQALAEIKIKPFPFDPNQLPEADWLKMGFTPKQVKSIKNYEAKGGKFRSKTDVKKMYALSEVEYRILEPYILLPEQVEYDQKPSIQTEVSKPEKQNYQKKKPKKVEINTADSSLLVDSLLLQPWLAERVVKYRNMLGGYYVVSQLGEVYGFTQTNLVKTTPYIIIDTNQILQIDLNNGTFKEILRHPYTTYEMTQAIVNKRQKEGKYTSVIELKEINLITDSIYTKLRPYFFAGR